MKYKIKAELDFTEDVLELDDDLTEEEVEKELYEYVSSFFYWGYKKVEEDWKGAKKDEESHKRRITKIRI